MLPSANLNNKKCTILTFFLLYAFSFPTNLHDLFSKWDFVRDILATFFLHLCTSLSSLCFLKVFLRTHYPIYNHSINLFLFTLYSFSHNIFCIQCCSTYHQYFPLTPRYATNSFFLYLFASIIYRHFVFFMHSLTSHDFTALL